jgi:translation initiation factor IF-2
VADIAVLVVAVDDGIMPQTVEAIKHILAAKVKMIVAVNKVDLLSTLRSPSGDLKTDSVSPELTVALNKIKKQLSDNGVLVEEYGGEVPVISLSAKSGEGVDKLLEMITLVAEISELKADPDLPAAGVVIESHLDKFKGPVATLLVRNGTLRRGDLLALGSAKGKVRGLMDFNGKNLDMALPSTPVEILGLEDVPAVGATLGSESPSAEATGDRVVQSLVEKLRAQDVNVLAVVIKADMQGSLEAIEDALAKFKADGEHVKVVASGTGEIGEADVQHAVSTKEIIVGFNTKMTTNAGRMAEAEHVLVRTYNVIYELIDEMEDVVNGMLKLVQLDEVFGTAQIIAEFPYGKNERIAGCKVLEGAFTKGPKVRIVRKNAEGEDEVVAETKIKSLKKVREDITRVEKGNECGMIFEVPVDFQVGDVVQSFRIL